MEGEVTHSCAQAAKAVVRERRSVMCIMGQMIADVSCDVGREHMWAGDQKAFVANDGGLTPACRGRSSLTSATKEVR